MLLLLFKKHIYHLHEILSYSTIITICHKSIYSSTQWRLYSKYFVWKLQFYSHLTKLTFDQWFPWIKYWVHCRCSINSIVKSTVFYKSVQYLCLWENVLWLLTLAGEDILFPFFLALKRRETIHFTKLLEGSYCLGKKFQHSWC